MQLHPSTLLDAALFLIRYYFITLLFAHILAVKLPYTSTSSLIGLLRLRGLAAFDAYL